MRVRRVFLERRVTKDFPAARDQGDPKAIGGRWDYLDFLESMQCRVCLGSLDREDLLAWTGATEQKVNLEYRHHLAVLADRDRLETRVPRVRKEILVLLLMGIKD